MRRGRRCVVVPNTSLPNTSLPPASPGEVSVRRGVRHLVVDTSSRFVVTSRASPRRGSSPRSHPVRAHASSRFAVCPVPTSARSDHASQRFARTCVTPCQVNLTRGDVDLAVMLRRRGTALTSARRNGRGLRCPPDESDGLVLASRVRRIRSLDSELQQGERSSRRGIDCAGGVPCTWTAEPS